MKTRLLVIVGIIALIAPPISTGLWAEYGMVCNNVVVKHLEKHSNLYDGHTSYYNYFLEKISMPFGVHMGNIQECIDFTFEQRILMKLENMTPICQNAISDWVDLGHKIDKVPEDVARNMNMSSMPEDVLHSMHIFSQDVLITEELLKQKNDATIAVLNHCDVESLTIGKIRQLDYLENRK